MLVTKSNFEQALRSLKRPGDLVLDFETTGLRTYQDRPCGVALCHRGASRRGDPLFYFPVYHYRDPDNLDEQHYQALLALLPGRTVWGHNVGKFDAMFADNDGADIDTVEWRCTMTGAYLWDENRHKRGKNYRLEDLGSEFFGPEAVAQQQALRDTLIAYLLDKGDMWRLPAAKVEPYACEDLILTDQLADYNHERLEKRGIADTVFPGVSQYSVVLGRIERRGLLIDIDLVRQAQAEARLNAEKIAQQIRDAGGPRIPTDDKLRKWLGVASLNADTMRYMKGQPEVELIEKFRAWTKAVGSYYRPFLVKSVNDIMHPNLNHTKLATGRLSCTDPNLQALPKDGSLYRVKEAIIARPGHVLIQADYKQAEMRLASYYGKERAMQKFLQEGKNIHQAVADELGIPYDAAKRINFSVIYGIGAETLSERLMISQNEAAMYLSKYHAKYPGFRRLYKQAGNRAHERKYVRMWSGRLRHYNMGHDTPTHKASDHLIQGGVGEILRVHQTAVDHELRKSHGVHQILQVHDSAVMEAPADDVLTLIPIIRDLMRDTRFYPHMEVDVSYGPNLKDMEEVA